MCPEERYPGSRFPPIRGNVPRPEDFRYDHRPQQEIDETRVGDSRLRACKAGAGGAPESLSPPFEQRQRVDGVPRLLLTSERRAQDSATGDHRSWSRRNRGCPMRQARPFPQSSPGSDRSLRLPPPGSGTGPSNPDSSRYP